MNCQRAPLSFSLISYKTSNSYEICSVWCVMRDVWCARPFCCKILNLWVKRRTKIPHLGSFSISSLYSKIDPRWQSYVHFILEGLLTWFQRLAPLSFIPFWAIIWCTVFFLEFFGSCLNFLKVFFILGKDNLNIVEYFGI